MGHVARVAHNPAVVLADERHVAILVDVRIEMDQAVVDDVAPLMEAQPACAGRQLREEQALGRLVLRRDRADEHAASIRQHVLGTSFDHAGIVGIGNAARLTQVNSKRRPAVGIAGVDSALPARVKL